MYSASGYFLSLPFRGLFWPREYDKLILPLFGQRMYTANYMPPRIVLLVDAIILRKINSNVRVDMVRKDKCTVVIIHRVFRSSVYPSWMSAAREYRENIPQTIMLPPSALSFLESVAGCLLSDVSRRIRQWSPMKRKIWFIEKKHLLPLSGCPVAVMMCRFQPSSLMNRSQHRCINQASVAEAHAQQRLLNRCWGDTVDISFVYLNGHLLNG